WEFVTTLDYEWRVIRGRLPYRWSIWVRNDWRLWFPWPLGRLLRRARSLSCGCSIYRSSYERYEPHSLSGEYRVLTPTPFLGSDLPRFKFWISMITRILVVFSLDFFLPVFVWRHSIDSPSHHCYLDQQ
ncbi:hypothetical protein BJV77DRAFT_998172, partial [Russula vinacea]